MGDFFNCYVCDKKFIKKDYKKPDGIMKVDYARREHRCYLATKWNDEDLNKTKWFNHLILPSEDPKGRVLKPWEFRCPNSMCIICFVKTGDSPYFKDRNAFKYHRSKRGDCPYKKINYKQYIMSKVYEQDKTFANMLDCIPDPEPEPEPEPVVEEKEEDEDPPVHTYFSLDKSPAELARLRREAMKRAKANGELVVKDKKKTNKKKEYDMINKNLELQIKQHQEEMNLV